MGIGFLLETAEQVTDNGNTWKCANCGCKKKAFPTEASLKSNLILEFNNASKLFSREKLDSFETISIQSYAFLTYQRDKKNNGWRLIMKPILGPLNVIIIIKPPHY